MLADKIKRLCDGVLYGGNGNVQLAGDLCLFEALIAIELPDKAALAGEMVHGIMDGGPDLFELCEDR